MLDFHMPDLNGMELAKKIKEHLNTTSMVVILLSSIQSQDITIDHSLIDGFLTKPIYPFDLYDIILAVLTKKNLL